MPGLEARLPLLFDAMVSRGRLGLEKFVALTSTEPAKIYGLHPRKGDIVIGGDADITIWDPNRRVTIGADLMHDLTGYSPYEGRTVTGWPVTVLSRGRVVVDDATLRVTPGSGFCIVPRQARGALRQSVSGPLSWARRAFSMVAARRPIGSSAGNYSNVIQELGWRWIGSISPTGKSGRRRA
jgi:hypothetical protein